MKKKIYLHIGWPKTGTSFLQSILFSPKNKEYLEHERVAPIRGIFSHSPVVELETINASTSDEIKESLSRKIADTPDASTYVLSQESMTAMAQNDVVKLGKALAGFDTHIIIYLRRQDELCESSWKQWYIKNMSFQEWLAHYMKNPMSFSKKLNEWSEVFGKENMIVRPYEKSQLPDGLEGDFFPLIGLKSDILHIPKSTVNTGFDRETLELLYHGRSNLKDIHDNRLSQIFSRYQEGKKEFERYNLLSVVERKAILELHREENLLIAKEYQGKEDGLFSMKINAQSDSEFDGLDLEKSVIFLTGIILDQEKEIAKLKAPDSAEPELGYKDILKALKRRIKS